MRLLIADDDAFIRVIAALDLPGMEIVDATRLSEAERLTQTRPPDAAVIDRWLPDGDGLGLVRWLRLYPATRSIPIVVLSPDPALADRARVYRAGADAYLAKPFEPDALLAAVTGAIRIPARDRRARRGRLANGTELVDLRAASGTSSSTSSSTPTTTSTSTSFSTQ
jgi:DNA-binding response OmpR family regulator